MADVFAAVIVLLAGINPNITVLRNGHVREKDRTWECAKTVLLSNVNGFLEELRGSSYCNHTPTMSLLSPLSQ